MTPRGPIGREQAGPPASHPDGALGGCPSQSLGHPHRAPAPGSATDHGGTRPAAAVPVPQATARPRPNRPTCPHSWRSTWQSVVARRTAGSGPVVAHHGSVAPVRRELAGRLLARCPPYRPRGLDLLVAEEPRGLGLPGAARRPDRARSSPPDSGHAWRSAATARGRVARLAGPPPPRRYRGTRLRHQQRRPR